MSGSKRDETEADRSGPPSRREFIAGCAAGTAALGLGACSQDPAEEGNVNQRLFGSYRELAQLDYFEIDEEGKLRCVVDFPPGTDIHVHFGFSYWNGEPVDLQASHDRVEYIFDCQESDGCAIDLDIYANQSISEASLDRGRQIVMSSLLGGSDGGPQTTHTIPNLLEEMDRMGLGKSLILPIAIENLDFVADNPSEAWAAAIDEAGAGDRLPCLGSVHPNDPNKVEVLERLAAAGFGGIKLHPSNQIIAADDPATMELYPHCDRLGLKVFYHSGRTGLEVSDPELVHMDRYVEPIREFPNIQFVLGHSGAVGDWEAAKDLAKDNENVWLCLAGPAIPVLEVFLDELGPERLLYGTDWPFYPQAMQLAKVLITTRRDATVRDMILAHNAERFLNAS